MRTEIDQLVRELPEAGIARATRLGLVLNPGLEAEAWRRLVTHVARLVRTSAGARQTLTAWLGDVLAYGETGVHERRVRIDGSRPVGKIPQCRSPLMSVSVEDELGEEVGVSMHAMTRVNSHAPQSRKLCQALPAHRRAVVFSHEHPPRD